MAGFVLEYPYSADWKRGYLVVNGEGRRTVILYNSPSDRSSTSYARCLVSVSVGRYLSDDEHVDHIDDDKTNDCIGNLQILTLKANNQKQRKKKGRLVVEIKCPVCGSHFLRRRGNSQSVGCNRDRVSCCSVVCSNKFKKLNITQEDRRLLSVGSIVSEFVKYE